MTSVLESIAQIFTFIRFDCKTGKPHKRLQFGGPDQLLSLTHRSFLLGFFITCRATALTVSSSATQKKPPSSDCN